MSSKLVVGLTAAEVREQEPAHPEPFFVPLAAPLELAFPFSAGHVAHNSWKQIVYTTDRCKAPCNFELHVELVNAPQYLDIFSEWPGQRPQWKSWKHRRLVGIQCTDKCFHPSCSQCPRMWVACSTGPNWEISTLIITFLWHRIFHYDFEAKELYQLSALPVHIHDHPTGTIATLGTPEGSQPLLNGMIAISLVTQVLNGGNVPSVTRIDRR